MRPERPDRADDQLAPCPDGEDGRGFGHSVAFEHRDADVIEKLVDVRRKRAAAGDRAAKLSANHVAQFLEHERIENAVRQRIDEHLEEAGHGETEGFKNGSAVHIEATTGEEESGGLVFA